MISYQFAFGNAVVICAGCVFQAESFIKSRLLERLLIEAAEDVRGIHEYCERCDHGDDEINIQQ